MDLFALIKVDGSDVNPRICLITPGCFNIQMSHGFENFCLFSYAVQNQVTYLQYVYNIYSMVDVTSVQQKESMEIKFSVNKILIFVRNM